MASHACNCCTLHNQTKDYRSAVNYSTIKSKKSLIRYLPKLADRQIVTLHVNTIYLPDIVSRKFPHLVKNNQILEKIEN